MAWGNFEIDEMLKGLPNEKVDLLLNRHSKSIENFCLEHVQDS